MGSVPAPTPRHQFINGCWQIPIEDVRDDKRVEISAAFDAYIAGSVTVSLGFPMQFNTRDTLMVRGAIELAQANEQTTLYLTDANDVTHYDVPVEDAEKLLFEVMGAAMMAHQKKQTLRAQILAATTIEEVEAIHW